MTTTTRAARTWNAAASATHTCVGPCGETKPATSYPTTGQAGRRGVVCRTCRDAARAARLAPASKYRWECSVHDQHGRWVTDPNAAGQAARNHWDRRGGRSESGTCIPHLVDDQGRDQGPAV